MGGIGEGRWTITMCCCRELRVVEAELKERFGAGVQTRCYVDTGPDGGAGLCGSGPASVGSARTPAC